MKWLLIVVGLYGCDHEPDADGLKAFYTQRECEAEASAKNKEAHPSDYEYRCIPMPERKS